MEFIHRTDKDFERVHPDGDQGSVGDWFWEHAEEIQTELFYDFAKPGKFVVH